MYMYYTCIHVGISIVDSDLTTDVVEPADFNRFVSCIQIM